METIKHYVEWIFPGTFVVESDIEPVKSKRLAVIKKIPKNAFYFRFFSRVETVAKGELLVGRPRDFSNKYYIDGEVLNLAQVKARYPQLKNLIDNMKSNNWKRVIKCRTNNFQPFTDKDINLDSKKMKWVME